MCGLPKERLVVDPGIGFGKTLEHNVVLLQNLHRFNELDVPVLLGTSRKRFIESIYPQTPVDKRLPGSIASVLWAMQKDVKIFRVHDVAETKQALKVFQALAA